MLGGDFTVSGNIVDIPGRKIYGGTVEVRAGRIAVITPSDEKFDTYLLPGFVDAHVHVESSLLIPSEFARLAVVHGTVATVSDPHEIANVVGTAGVDYMLADARRAPLKISFGAPSCVPATPFDHAGATLGPEAVAQLLDRPEIRYLSEMMNFPGVVSGVPDVLAKCAAARQRNKPIDGHAPGLRGDGLVKYIAQRILTDHECVAIDEAREKLERGMKILIREGSAARNFDALWPLLKEAPDRVMLCSDDKHSNDLVLGHIDVLVRRALANGVPLFNVLQAACVNPVLHYGLPVGLLRVSDPADLIEVDSLEQFAVLRTWIDGTLVAERGSSLLPHRPGAPINQFAARPKSPADFALKAEGRVARVIEAVDGMIITRRSQTTVKFENGLVVADPANDVLKIASVDRYADGRPSVVLVRNFGLRHGAIASTVAHDSHNIVAVGADDASLARAVNLLVENQGGISCVGPGVEAVLPLPVAGLMSGDDGYRVAAEYARLDELAKQLGSQLAAPYMTLSFMALLVIPTLKLGPEGLFDVDQFAPVSLWVE
ncbi:MAG: adenine deaminase [Planctomycetes bacterium]|nr:adenine deaminase [Planctomycetota bacterium]